MPTRQDVIDYCVERMKAAVRTQLADFRRLREFETSDDIVQNATVRLLKAFDAVGPESVFDIHGLSALVIRRELINLTRHYFGPQGHGTNTITVGDSRIDGVTEDDSTDPWAAIHVHEAVETLDAEMRVVVDLMFYQGLTQEQAAEVLGIGVATVRRRWRQARAILGSALG